MVCKSYNNTITFFSFQIEQLHKIFKLYGSPAEEYWKKVKPPTFRPPQNYKPCFGEVFPNFPHSAFSLLYTLVPVEPHFRGTAATALQNEVKIFHAKNIVLFYNIY